MLKRMTCFLSAFLLFGAANLQAAELPDFTQLIEKNSPAVVKIEVEGTAAAGRVRQDIPEIFRHFFDQQQRRQPERKTASMGSGFVVSADGYVLTNNHVVDQADKIVVRFSDRDEYTAEVIGTDPSTDLALLKVDAKNLPTIQFGDSDRLKVGEWVVAIGSPFGLDYSASVGIVSALGRSLPTADDNNIVPFIQTDVAINPGNSGGPLFNLSGEVVGINSQILSRSGGSNGISFSIPAHVAQRVVAQLKETGSVSRGWFGISMSPLTKDMARAFELDKTLGVLVNGVVPDGPAETAGLEAGDVIVDIAGKPVATMSDLSHIVANTVPGEKVAVDVIRNGERQRLNLEVGVRGEAQQLASAGGDKLGLAVDTLEERTRVQLRLRGGVVVDSVVPDSPAATTGLQKGDIIERIGQYRVLDVDAYAQLVKAIPEGQPVAIRIFRNGRPIFTTIVVN